MNERISFAHNTRVHDVLVADTASELVEMAVKHICSRACGSGKVGICLTGGSTPKPIYEQLAKEPYRSLLPWHRIHWFWGDERLVPLEHPLSNAGMALNAFLAHVPAPAANIHTIPTGATNEHEAASLYESNLIEFYGGNKLVANRPLFDLVLLGVGSDGHTASLFPGSKALLERDRWVVGVEKAGLAPFVPRVTLTFPALSSAGEVLFVAAGADKRAILNRVWSGEDLPAAHAESAGDLVWLVDKPAAVDLRGMRH
jgi:6-phosphogluconolactonase